MTPKKAKRLLSFIVSLTMASSLVVSSMYTAVADNSGDDAEVSSDFSVGDDDIIDDVTDDAAEADDAAEDDDASEGDEAAEDDDVTIIEGDALEVIQIVDDTQSDETDDTESDESEGAAENTGVTIVEEELEAVQIEDDTQSETTGAAEENEGTEETKQTEQSSAVTELQEAIDSLPSVSKLADMDTDEQDEVYTLISNLWDIYNYELTEDEQSEVDITALEELSDYFNGAIVTLASTDATNPGVTGSTVTDYVNHAHAYAWNFSNVSTTLSAGTYDAGNGLVFTLNSDSSINSNYNGIYGCNWIYDDTTYGTDNATASQYVTFTPTDNGTLYFDAYYEAYTTRAINSRIYYTTNGNLPIKSTNDTTSTIIEGSEVYNSTGESTLTGLSLSVESGTTYILAIYRGATVANSALYNFKFIASSDIDNSITPISGSFDSSTGDYGAYTWDYVSTGTGASTYTYNNYCADITIGVGSGDSLIAASDATDSTSYGIHYSASSVKETDTTGQTCVGDTGRYIMVKPVVAGTLAFKIAFSGSNNRVYYDSSDSGFTSTQINALAKQDINSSDSKYVGSSYSLSGTNNLLSIGLEAGTTYVFYTYQNASYIYDMTFTPSSDLGITSKNVDVNSGEIAMNAYVSSKVGTVDSVTSTIGGVESTKTPTVTYDEGNSRYTISQNVLATQMADEIVYTITLTDGSTCTYKTSVKEYANTLINANDTNDNTKTVLKTMLDYGSAVQQLADSSVTGTDLANDGTYQSDVENVTADTIKEKATKTTDTTGTWNGATLSSMNMNFNYNFNLAMTYGDSLDDYTIKVTVDGSDVTNASCVKTGNSIVIKDLTAAQLSKALVVTLTDSSGNTYATTTSALYYARLLVNGGSNEQQQVGKTLYKYVTAVDALSTTAATE